MNQQNKLKVFETFAGIGAQTKALKNINVEHEVVATSEWDINAIISYAYIHQKDEMQINIISVDKISDNNFLIKTYKNRNSETPNLILKINIEENENITPKLYLLDLSRNIHHKILLELQKTVGKNNFLIKSIEIDYRNGYKSFQEVTDLYIKRTVFKL